MKRLHRLLAIMCLFYIVLCLTGCSKDAQKESDELAKELTSGINYKATELPSPEKNYIFSSICADEHIIYVYGYPISEESTSSEIQLYNLNGEHEGSFEIPRFSDKYRSTIMNTCADNNGNLWLLKYLNEYELVNGELKISDAISSWLVEAYSRNGKLLTSFEVGDESSRWTNITSNSECILIAGGDGIWAFDSNGNVLSSHKDSYVVSSFFDNIGQANVVFNKLGKKQVGVLDIQSGKIMRSSEIPDVTNRVMADPDGKYDFIIEMSGAIYGAKAGNDLSLIADFVDYSIIHNSKGIIPLSDGKLLIYNSQKLQLFEPSGDDGLAITLTLGTLDSRFLSNMVEKFNASNDSYKIKIVDYSQYNLSKDSSEGITKLNTEIISGNGPDIFDLCSLPAAQYERAGILVDLYPYINGDEQTKNIEFVEPVVDALETDGKLYKLVPSYSVLTFVGSQQFFQKSALSYEQLALLSANGNDPFNRTFTKRSFLECILSVDKPAFIDLEKNCCDFDSEAFIYLLNYMNSLPDIEEPMSESNNIMSGEQLLSHQYISGYHDICYFNYLFNSTVCFSGVPSSQGAGGIICPYLCLGISQNCHDKDGAWQFLKQYLLDDYQNLAAEDGVPFPISKSALDLKECAFRKWAEESGEMYVGPDNTGKDVMLHIFEDEEKEAVEKIDELFTTIIGVYNNDFNLPDLIWECINPYFAGEKTAEEVAAATQSRASIYMAEQYG